MNYRNKIEKDTDRARNAQICSHSLMLTFFSHYQSTSIMQMQEDGLSLDTNGSDELRLAVMSYARLRKARM